MNPPTSSPTGYLPRIMDRELPQLLRALGATAIFGVRGCGLLTTARRFSTSETVIDSAPPQYDSELARAVERQVLDGEAPRLVREWARQPWVSDVVRHAVDDRQAPGQFILTSTVHPPRGTRAHPGTGRYAVRRMRPMTLYEQGGSTGMVSLRALLDGHEPTAGADAAVAGSGYRQPILTGGWPALIGASPADARQYLSDYLDRLIRYDLPEALGRTVNPTLVRAYLAAHADAIGRPATIQQILDAATDPTTPSIRSARSYHEALARLMIRDDIYLLWAPATTMVRNLADPSLAAVLLGRSTSAALRADPRAFRILFTCLALRDLRAYADHHWVYLSALRDRATGHPVCIMEEHLGRPLVLAIAAGRADIDAAAGPLRQRRYQLPAGLYAVLTSGKAVRQRQDRIWEIPLSCLGP